MTDPWDVHAEWWREGFTEGADPEYEEQILPLLAVHVPPGASVLDVGCGEGQVGRLLARERDAVVVGVDGAAAQVAEARRRGGLAGVVRGAATLLPVRPASVDVVVACLVLEHVADLDAALDEAAAVLGDGGRFLVVLNHPIVQTPGSGWVDDHLVDPPEQYWQLGPYLAERSTVEQVGPGVFITFHHRPLSRYLNAARARGLVLDHLAEPPPPPGFLELAPEFAEQSSMPRLLFLRFARHSGEARPG